MSAVKIAGVPASILVAGTPGSTLGFNFQNDLSGGTNATGITVANSGGASGTPFNAVNQGTGGSIQYSNTHHRGGSGLSAKIVTPAGITSALIWSTVLSGLTGPTNRIRTRQTINMTIGTKIQVVKVLAPSSVFVGGIYIDATGHVLIEDSGFATKATSTNVVTSGSDFRIEVAWIFNATTGSISVDIYLNPDSSTPTETISASSLNTNTSWSQVNFEVVNTGASSVTVYQWGFGASNKGGKMGAIAYPAQVPGTGVQAQITVAGGIGSVKAGTGVHIHGAAAAISIGGIAGVVKEGARVHGVAATITIAGTPGTVNSAKIHGTPAAIAVSGTAGTIKTGSHVPGHSAAITVAGGIGITQTGSAAIVHGTSASIAVAGTPGSVKAGTGVHIHGAAAAISIAGVVGHPSVGVRIHGAAAAISVNSGTGRVSVGSRIHGVAAIISFAGNPGVLDVPNVAATVPGAAALISVAGGAGHTHAVSRVFGRAAQIAVAGGIGSPRLTSGNPNPTVILDTVKKVLGFFPEYAAFDTEIMIHINAAIGELRNMGIGPAVAFKVTGRTQLWADFWSQTNSLGMIQTFIFLYVRLNFDMPGTSFNINNFENQLAELESRLLIMAETLSPPSDPFAA